MPILSKVDSSATPSHSGLAIQTNAAKKPMYWIGRKT